MEFHKIEKEFYLLDVEKTRNLFRKYPATVNEEEKVSVFEALYDLDFVGNDDEAHRYELVDISKQYNGTAKKMNGLLKHEVLMGNLTDKWKNFF